MAKSSSVSRNGLVWLALVPALLTSCQRYEEASGKPVRPTPKPAATQAKADQPAAKPGGPAKVKYSRAHDEEVKEIFSLAGNQQWEEAEDQAKALLATNPTTRQPNGWLTG